MFGMRGYVGVTDEEWFRFLAARPEISEAKVNFWRPGGGRRFHALEHGEPFFFKTRAPHNRVVGGGFYSGFAALPCPRHGRCSASGTELPAWSRCGPA
jgi:putative restriction endonuclease